MKGIKSINIYFYLLGIRMPESSEEIVNLEELFSKIDRRLGTNYSRILDEYIDSVKGVDATYGTSYFATYFVDAVMLLQKLYDAVESVKEMISEDEYRLLRNWLDKEKEKNG